MAESSRRKILNAAIAAIEEGGEASVNVRDVASKAGFSVAMIRHYFENREGLIIAARTEHYQASMLTWFPEMARIVNEATTATELREGFLGFLDRVFVNDGFSRRMSRLSDFGSSYRRPQMATEFDRVHREFAIWVRALLISVQERGWLRDNLDIESASLLYIAIVTGRTFIETWANEDTLTEWNRQAKESIMNLIFGPSES